MYPFSIQNLMALSRAAGSQFLLNSVCESPAPPKLSPDGEAGESDAWLLDAPGLDQLVQRGLRHRIGAEQRPGVVYDALSDDR